MFRLMVSFKRDDIDRFGISNHPYDFFVNTSEDVCEIIFAISHLKPVVTLCQEEILTSKEVLEKFRIEEVGDLV